MPLPQQGKWRLVHPLTGSNPPFAILDVDLATKNGTALLNMRSYPLLQIVTHPGNSSFLVRYRVGNDHGMLEAKYQSDRSLRVEFSGGTVETTCTGELITATGLIDGPASAEPSDPIDPAKYAIHCPGDLARMFDGMVIENEHGLKVWCDRIARDNPDAWITVGLARTATDLYSVAAKLGAGTVDTLRIGEGCYEGGWGIGKDLLRALSFVPLFGRAKSVVGKIAQWRGAGAAVDGAEAVAVEAGGAGQAGRKIAPIPPQMRVTAPIPSPMRVTAPIPPRNLAPIAGVRPTFAPVGDPGGPICAWTAVGNAVRLFTSNMHVTVDTLFAAAGRAAGSRVNIEELVLVLRNRFQILMVQLTEFRPNVDAAERIVEVTRAQPPGSVIVFSVSCNGGRHAMVALAQCKRRRVHH